jgi:hypothetical protein
LSAVCISCSKKYAGTPPQPTIPESGARRTEETSHLLPPPTRDMLEKCVRSSCHVLQAVEAEGGLSLVACHTACCAAGGGGCPLLGWDAHFPRNLWRRPINQRRNPALISHAWLRVLAGGRLGRRLAWVSMSGDRPGCATLLPSPAFHPVPSPNPRPTRQLWLAALAGSPGPCVLDEQGKAVGCPFETGEDSGDAPSGRCWLEDGEDERQNLGG